MEYIGLLTLVISIIVTVAFFVLVGNVSAIHSTLKGIHEEQQKIYKALYQIAKIKMEEREQLNKPQ